MEAIFLLNAVDGPKRPQAFVGVHLACRLFVQSEGNSNTSGLRDQKLFNRPTGAVGSKNGLW